EAKVKLRNGACWNRCFDAGPLIASCYAAHREGRSNRGPLVETVAGLAARLRRASPAEHLGVGGSDLRHVSTFTRVPSPHPVIEAGNGDRASAVVQPADHFAERLQGIADDSAEDPGMKLAVCASRFDLDAEASPKRIGDCGPARAGDLHVGNDGAIGRE